MLRSVMQILLVASVTFWLSFSETESSLVFEGCYAEMMEDQGESSFDRKNENGLCVRNCRQLGYIIAATKGRQCHCSNFFPREKLASAGSKYVSGHNSRCNTPCPGILETEGCEGDECCGGNDAYSVYAVGGVDIPLQVWKRVKSNLYDVVRHRGLPMIMLWAKLPDCDDFHRFSGKVLSRPRNSRWMSSLADCERYCDVQESFACVAYSFTSYRDDFDGECRIYDHLTPMEATEQTSLLVRRCLLDTSNNRRQQFGLPTILANGGEASAHDLKGFVLTRDNRDSADYKKICRSEDGPNNSIVADIACRQIGFQGGYAWPYAMEGEPQNAAIYSTCNKYDNMLQECEIRPGSCTKGALYVVCIGKGPIMVNDRLNLKLEKYERNLRENAPSSSKPMGSRDQEIDNTQSNETQEMRFTIEKEETHYYTWQSETGFSRETSASRSLTRRFEHSSSSSLGASLGVSVSATASVSVFGFGGSVSTELSSNFETEERKAISRSSSRTSTQTESRRHIFTEGYITTSIKAKSTADTYILTVPPFHRGLMNFFEEETAMTLKWRSSFMLHGYIELQFGPVKHNVSSIDLLQYEQRKFFTLGSLNFKTKKSVNQVTMIDSMGKAVRQRDPNEHKCTHGECKFWHGDAALCDGVACHDIECPVNRTVCLQEHPELSSSCMEESRLF